MNNTPSNKNYWFKRRRYGYGWIPAHKYGWITVSLFLILMLAGVALLGEEPTGEQTMIFLAITFVAVLALISLSYLKGPKPKWRWGKSEDDNPEEDW